MTKQFGFTHLSPLVTVVIFVLLSAFRLEAQTFVRTIADTPAVAAATDPVLPAQAEAKAKATTFNVPLRADIEKFVNSVKAGAVTDVSEPQREKLTAALVRQKLQGLATVDEDEFEKRCKEVEPALTNNFMPTLWESERSACFWQQRGLDSLRSARLSGTTNHGTAAVELLSNLFWGLRVKVQSGVTASDGDENENAEDRAKRNLQQLLASGGNLSFSGTYPWYLHRSKAEKVQSLFTSFGRIGAVVPVLGQDDGENSVGEDDINASFELGIVEAQTRIESFEGGMNFVAFGRIGAVHGTKHFHHDIGNEDEALFGYGEVGAGFRLYRTCCGFLARGLGIPRIASQVDNSRLQWGLANNGGQTL